MTKFRKRKDNLTFIIKAFLAMTFNLKVKYQACLKKTFSGFSICPIVFLCFAD